MQEEQIQTTPAIGDRVGAKVYAGISPDTGKPMYVGIPSIKATDSFKSFNKAARQTGRRRIPSKNELAVLFANAAKLGGFDKSGDFTKGWYMSSTSYEVKAEKEGTHQESGRAIYAQRFSDGAVAPFSKDVKMSVRYILD